MTQRPGSKQVQVLVRQPQPQPPKPDRMRMSMEMVGRMGLTIMPLRTLSAMRNPKQFPTVEMRRRIETIDDARPGGGAPTASQISNLKQEVRRFRTSCAFFVGEKCDQHGVE